eukprot:3392497-Prorocentrum_lima.AAC.1
MLSACSLVSADCRCLEPARVSRKKCGTARRGGHGARGLPHQKPTPARAGRKRTLSGGALGRGRPPAREGAQDVAERPSA